MVVPLLLDPRADPTTMFGPYQWLAPASMAPAQIAASVAGAVFARSSSTHDRLPAVDDLGRSAGGSHREALRVANRAITQARLVHRVVRSAAIAVVTLTGLLAVLVRMSNQGARGSLLIIVFPLIGCAAALATLRPTRRNP